VATVATNNCLIELLVGTKKYNRSVSIPQSKIIAKYNQLMGDVNLHDNGMCNYRINTKCKKC